MTTQSFSQDESASSVSIPTARLDMPANLPLLSDKDWAEVGKLAHGMFEERSAKRAAAQEQKPKSDAKHKYDAIIEALTATGTYGLDPRQVVDDAIHMEEVKAQKAQLAIQEEERKRKLLLEAERNARVQALQSRAAKRQMRRMARTNLIRNVGSLSISAIVVALKALLATSIFGAVGAGAGLIGWEHSAVLAALPIVLLLEVVCIKAMWSNKEEQEGRIGCSMLFIPAVWSWIVFGNQDSRGAVLLWWSYSMGNTAMAAVAAPYFAAVGAVLGLGLGIKGEIKRRLRSRR